MAFYDFFHFILCLAPGLHSKREKENSLSQKLSKKKQNASKETFIVENNVCVEEIDEKYHTLVGQNKFKYPAPISAFAAEPITLFIII